MKVKTQVSLKNIAEKCGLSISTVSQILNDRPSNYSSEATRRKVRETAKKMGYRTNFGYKLMRGQATRTVAILSSMIHMKSEEHIRNLVISLMTEFDARDYAAYFSPLGGDILVNLNKIRDFLARGVGHFIILGTPVGYREMEEMIENAGKIMVASSTCFQRYLAVDTTGGAIAVMRFLLKKGGENFRFVAPEQGVDPQQNRIKALQQCLPDLAYPEILRRYIRPIPNFNLDADNFSDAAYQAGFAFAGELFAAEAEIKAVCCNIDSIALGVAEYLVRSGKVIGRDVYLGGFNNDYGVRNSPYPISSVDHDWGQRSSMLIDAALNPGECQQLLEPKIYIRELT